MLGPGICPIAVEITHNLKATKQKPKGTCLRCRDSCGTTPRELVGAGVFASGLAAILFSSRIDPDKGFFSKEEWIPLTKITLYKIL